MPSFLSERSTLKQLLLIFLGMSLYFALFLAGVAEAPRQSIFQQPEPATNSQSPALYRISVELVHAMRMPAFVLSASIAFLILALWRRAERLGWIYAVLAGFGLAGALRLLFLGFP